MAAQLVSLNTEYLNDGFIQNDTLIDSNDPLDTLIMMEAYEMYDDISDDDERDELINEYVAN